MRGGATPSGGGAQRPGRDSPAAAPACRLVPLLLLLSLLGSLALPPPPAAAAPAAASERAERSRRDELVRLRADIARLEERLAEVSERRETLASRLETVGVELELQERRLEEARSALALASDEVAASEADVARLEAAVAASRRALAGRLSGLYRLGRRGYLALALSLEPGADLLDGIRLLRYLARRDAEAIERHETARRRLAAERERLAARRREAEEWAAEEAARRDGLAAVKRRSERLLAEARAEGERLAREAASLAEREDALAAMIEALAGDEASLGGRPIGRFRRALDWPVEGEVTTGFGPRRDPRYRTETPHNGIAIATEPGGTVRAVFPGRVLFAAPFEGYGPTVVLHHAGRGFSLYAGLERLLVEPDAVVSLSDPVGVASGSLYFEIRIDNRPVDPLEWLR